MSGKRRRRLTGRESSLFDYMDVSEKLWCPFCYNDKEVEETRDNQSLLSCGHVVLRESNARLKELHEWNVAFGFPKRPRGWWQPPAGTWEIYPTVTEMGIRAKLDSRVVSEIRKRMGRDWEPED